MELRSSRSNHHRSSIVCLILALVATAILFRLHWLLFPPDDPEFSWRAMITPRDLGYIEVESCEAQEGDGCRALLHAPNGRAYGVKGCAIADLAQDWEMKVRLACRWKVETEDFLGITYEKGRHVDCRILDIIYLGRRGKEKSKLPAAERR